jgi:hypothetical protein
MITKKLTKGIICMLAALVLLFSCDLGGSKKSSTPAAKFTKADAFLAMIVPMSVMMSESELPEGIELNDDDLTIDEEGVMAGTAVITFTGFELLEAITVSGTLTADYEAYPEGAVTMTVSASLSYTGLDFSTVVISGSITDVISGSITDEGGTITVTLDGEAKTLTQVDIEAFFTKIEMGMGSIMFLATEEFENGEGVAVVEDEETGIVTVTFTDYETEEDVTVSGTLVIEYTEEDTVKISADLTFSGAEIAALKIEAELGRDLFDITLLDVDGDDLTLVAQILMAMMTVEEEPIL